MADNFLDSDGMLYFMDKLKGIFQKQEAGKSLSTNDFTNAHKTTLANCEADRHTHGNKSVLDEITTEKVTAWNNGQANVIEKVKVNGTALSIAEKAVNVTVPTKTSDISNDSGYITASDSITGNAATATKASQDGNGNVISNTYAKISSPTFTGTPKAPTATKGDNSTTIATTAFVTTAVTEGLNGITGIEYQKVNSLPTTGAKGVIYLVSNNGSGQNVYDEYIWFNDAFEKIGTTAVDLSGYWTKADLTAITNSQIDEICK